MSPSFPVSLTLALVASALLQVHGEELMSEACDAETPVQSSAFLQVKKTQACSYQLQGDQDGSQACAHLKKGSYTSGKDAALDESGYQETSQLCCHHEMSLFVRREVQAQGFDVCDLSDLHGFVHWYDCTNDNMTFAMVQAEIAGNMASNCPFLGHLPNCPVQGPNCREFPPCPVDIPAGSEEGIVASLDEAGYAAVALRCCHIEMEQFVRREIVQQGFDICDEGALQGFLHWFDCADDGQTYAKLKEGIVIARSGLPPMCPWLGSVGEACPPKGHNCPWVEVAEPAAHRRRTACR